MLSWRNKSFMGITSKPFQRSMWMVATTPTSTAAGHAAAWSRTRQIHKIASPRPLFSSTLARAKDMTGLHMDASRYAGDQVLPDTSAPQHLPTRRHYVKPTFSRATPCATGILPSYAVPQTVSKPLRQALNLKLQRMCRKSVGTRIEYGLNDTELAKARRVWTVPNVICVFRMAVTPGISWLVVSGHHELAFYGLVVAGVSDGLDGFIARQMDQKSVLGSYLDPLADKLLIMSLSTSCALVELLPWWVVAIIVARDSFLMTGAYVLARREAEKRGISLIDATFRSHEPLEIQATALSKGNTVLQLSLLSAAMAGAAFPASQVGYMVPALAYATSATTLASMADYLRRPGYVK